MNIIKNLITFINDKIPVVSNIMTMIDAINLMMKAVRIVRCYIVEHFHTKGKK